MIKFERFQLVNEMIVQLVVCQIIAIDLSKQEALYADPKAKQQIKFTRNLNQAGGATMFFVIEEAKELFWIFHKKL